MTANQFLGEEFATSYDEAKVVILPVPYDGSSTYGKGADKGPQAMLDASEYVELYDIKTKSEPYTKGIFTAPALNVSNSDDPKVVVDKIQECAAQYIADGKFVIMLGGEHSISTGLARPLYEKYPNLSVLHFDAHGDTRESYNGSKYNHACVIARIREFAPVVQVGIRSIDIEEVETKKDNQHIFFAHHIHDNNDWMDDAVSKLTDNVFITIDLDVFDPSIMPSTGTPEPGGMLWYQVMTLLEKVFAKKNVVGCDVVELAPIKNLKAPDFLAAKLVYRLIAMKN